MKLSHHAILRMAQREIAPREVEQALANVVSTDPADRPSRVVKVGTTEEGKRLRITQNTFEPQHVITVVRLEKHS
ncbi:MAG TPA: DUF4258 domain-containing protein [Actinomycetota bacterium]|nr:DUF4258 domain-containing protein [Actinomycetota bacterium]